MIKVTEDVIIISRSALFDWITGEVNRVKESEGEVSVDDSSSDTSKSEPQSVDLFESKDGIGGTLQDAPDGRKKIDEVMKWLKDNKFSYANFCTYLASLTEVGGWPMAKPIIGNKSDGKPSLFYLAYRYYSFWKSQSDSISKEYKKFLYNQVRDMGYTVEAAAKILEGEVIDPSELPKGTEVSV
jgi:hypothetical protein